MSEIWREKRERFSRRVRAEDWAASVSAYVGIISAVKTLKQTHALHHIPGWLHLQNKCRHSPECSTFVTGEKRKKNIFG